MKWLFFIIWKCNDGLDIEFRKALKTCLKRNNISYDRYMMIGAVLIEEMYDIMKNKVPFNEKRYAEKLSMPPK